LVLTQWGTEMRTGKELLFLGLRIRTEKAQNFLAQSTELERSGIFYTGNQNQTGTFYKKNNGSQPYVSMARAY